MPAAGAKKNRGFDPNSFLAIIGDGRKILAVTKKQTIFTQGDKADAIFYVQKGRVRLTVVSKAGKEATIGLVSEGSSLVRDPWRVRFCVWAPPRH